MAALGLRSTQVKSVVSTLIVLAFALAVIWLDNRGADDAGSVAVESSPSSTTTGSSGAPTEPTAAGTAQVVPGSSPGPVSGTDPGSGLPWIGEDEITPEGRSTLALIDAGGPFPYPDDDGGTFGNYEGLLPRATRGYYREYTVPTPGEGDRGARRIVTGDGGEFYWTDDHYASFSRIRRE